MMLRFYRALPGPTAIRVATAVVLLAIFLVALHFFYEWVGNNFLDTGGVVE